MDPDSSDEDKIWKRKQFQQESIPLRTYWES